MLFNESETSLRSFVSPVMSIEREAPLDHPALGNQSDLRRVRNYKKDTLTPRGCQGSSCMATELSLKAS